MPSADRSSGTTSASKMSRSGSGRRRSRGASLSDGSRGSRWIRYAVATLIADCAAATGSVLESLSFMNNLI